MSLEQRNTNIDLCQHCFNNQDRDFNKQFYEEYKKTFLTGCTLSKQIKALIDNKQQLWEQLLAYENRTVTDFNDKMRKSKPQRKKRHRRTATQIQKTYECSAQRCKKVYGSEGSLYQHIKLKHPQLFAELQAKRKEQESQSME